MAFDVSNALIMPSITDGMLETKQAVQQMASQKQANALRQQQADQQSVTFGQEQDDRQNAVNLATAQHVLASSNPRLALQQAASADPHVAQFVSSMTQDHGVDLSNTPDEDVRGMAQTAVDHFSSLLRKGPAQPAAKDVKVLKSDDSAGYLDPQTNRWVTLQAGTPKPKAEDEQLVNVDDGKGGYRTIRRADFQEGRNRLYEKPNQGQGEGKPQRVNVTLPDGSTQETWILPGQTTGQPIGAPVRQRPTEGQAKANVFGQRMMEADRIISGTDYSPAAINAKAAAGGIPLIGGALEMGGNMMLGENNQMAEQAQRDFINAVLRKESGSAISNSEFENARKQYFPQALDSPKVKEQKQRNRQLAIAGMRAEAANFWGAGVENQGGAPPAAESAAARAKRMGL